VTDGPISSGRAAGTVAAIRIARRDALRHKARSVLVVVMIALPVLALTGADVLARTMQLSTSEKVTRALGQADVELTIAGGTVSQVGTGGGWSSDGTPALPGSAEYAKTEAAARRLLPGARMIDRVEAGGPISTSGRRLEGVEIQGLDLRDPMTKGIAKLVSGRFARSNDEVALSQPLLGRLHVTVGDSVAVAGRPFRIVGVIRNPQAVKSYLAYLLPTAVPGPVGNTVRHLLADTAQPVTWPVALKLNAHGIVAQSRSVMLHPPAGVQLASTSALADRARTIGIATVAVGLAVLEVVLLAGATFAVGARRQRRNLALVAAAGGDERHVRRIVLAGGLVLGVVGALVGVLGGIAVGRFAIPVAQRFADADAGHFDLRPVELLAVALIGVVTGLLAAVLPARTAARDDVVAALTGRRGAVATAKRVPALGLAMIVLGALVAAYAAHPPARFTMVLVGAVVAEIGFVVCAPAVVGAAGRAARLLPLPVRLAVRDASRHRGRTGPAVAAVLAAVAGSVAVSAWVTSQVAYDRQSYHPQLRVGQSAIQVFPDGTNPTPTRADISAVVTRDLPVTGMTAMSTTNCFDAQACSGVYLRPSSTCRNGSNACALDLGSGGLAVGDTTVLDALLGHHDARAAAALERGSLVVFSKAYADSGRATLVADTPAPSSNDGQQRTMSVASYVDDVGHSGVAVNGIMTPATADRLHVTSQPWGYLLDTSRMPTTAEQDRALSDLSRWSTNIDVERGFHEQRWNYGLIALAGAAALITLGATAVATALSAADSRPDLVTLAAVGAGPWLRRRFAAHQAATVAVLGTLLGALAGLVPAYGVIRAHGGMPFAVPWQTIGFIVLGVPVLAALVTGGLTRSRLPSERRAT
jgi:putative ABC transport system permease protein